MRSRNIAALALAGCLGVPAAVSVETVPARAYEVEKYHVYCADDRIEVSFWDKAQMIVRRGNPVCELAVYTSYSSALNFAQKNFGGEGASCFCE
ncbi:MAG: hypothetical protein AB7S80_02320 [Rhizobiaceae bacterium]